MFLDTLTIQLLSSASFWNGQILIKFVEQFQFIADFDYVALLHNLINHGRIFSSVI